MLLWYTLVLSARCYEIPLDRAEQSSDYSANYLADMAMDNDLATQAITKLAANNWLLIHFKSSSTVGTIVMEKGNSHRSACVYTVSVMDGETGTVCGTYTGKYQ